MKAARLVGVIWLAIILRDITPELAQWLANRLATSDDMRAESETDHGDSC